MKQHKILCYLNWAISGSRYWDVNKVERGHRLADLNLLSSD